MESINSILTRHLDVIFFIYGLAFVAMGIAILLQPKKASEHKIASIFWLLAMFGITHGVNEWLDMWAIIKGRHPLMDNVRWFILVISYVFLFEFGRRFFRLKRPNAPEWQKKSSRLLVWWLVPLIGTIIFIAAYISSDFWKTGSIWTRYLLGLPGGLLIGIGFFKEYEYEKEMLEPLKVKKFFMCSGAAFIVYGILGGIIVPRGDFFPSNWLNTESFFSVVQIPVQVFRTLCALAAAWSVSGILKIFNWEMMDKLQRQSSNLENINKELELEIIERKQVELALYDSHERLLLVLDSLDSIVFVADMKTHEILFANKYTMETFGDLIGRICWQTLHPGQPGPCDFCVNDKLLADEGNPEGVFKWEFRNSSNGRWYLIHDRAIHWVDGRLVCLEIATDITDLKLAQEQIKLSLREKEVLLKEIHHRAKNNMQVISSLLNMQSELIDDKQIISMFSDCRDRIISMSLVHEKLYQSNNLTKIDFHDYIKTLSRGLFVSHGISPGNVSMLIDTAGIDFSIDIAIPCGLIINELISNSLKYAFPDGNKGEIKIALSKTAVDDSNEYNITVSDNGIGLPENIDIRKSKSLGLQLVVNLAEHQLQGEIEMRRSKGTEFHIRFKEPTYQKRV